MAQFQNHFIFLIIYYSREQGTGNREQGTPEEKSSLRAVLASVYVLTALATAIKYIR
ncbi:hypothetical protein PL8927_690011 [Planktothrix serta PCC 8927]|uniref:Uncharacterized protein n=1 Tax=Planktothrix serta PCC 8927 TaxID=671068 RepID=A0A7Z9E0T1_9CYAN|nr:hypothetical protein PL8927_690011 [Planktothrix serta PCC 8927]